MTAFIRIEAQTLMQDGWATYFVDRVDDEAHSSIHRTTDISQARSVAREYADREGLRVMDETYVPEVMAGFSAKSEANEVIEQARTAVREQFQHFYEVMGRPDSRDALAILQNRGMPQSTKERQEALRAKRAMLGMTEVRGIYLPPALHAELKAHAEKLRRRVSATFPTQSEQTSGKAAKDAE